MATENLNYYTEREQNLNFYTHVFGVVLSIISAPFIIYKCCKNLQAQNLISVIVYLLSLINLLLMSSIYHSSKTYKRLKIAQKLDHLSISLLIAGTSTPMILLGIGGTPAIVMISLIWSMAAINIVCNIVNVKKFRAPTMLSYIIMGSMALIYSKLLLLNMGPVGFALLIGGDVGYLLGLIFYSKKSEYMHAVWHIFVLLGSILHYFSILYLL